MVDDKVVTIKEESGQIVDTSNFHWDLSLGYPRLECYYQSYYWSGLPNRYIAIFNQEYCILDSNFSQIIPFGDTIIPIWFRIPPYTEAREYTCIRSEIECYYQVVKNDSTTLYDNEGNQFIQKRYIGLLEPQYFEIALNPVYDDRRKMSSEYFITCDLNYNKYGIIDKKGSTILALNHGHIMHWSGVISNSIYRICERDTSNSLKITSLYDAGRKEYIIEAEMIAGPELGHLLNTYFHKGKWGIYHPEIGIIVNAKYDRIELIENEIFLFAKKRRKKWKPPKHVKLYFKEYKST